MKAVVLQPMYLPWMGYFGMIDQADTFVFYDDVQFTRRSWQRRNRIKVPDGEFKWLTVPVRKDFGQNINDVEVKAENNWEDSHWKSIRHSYGGSPHFEDYAEQIEKIYNTEWSSLVELDVSIIRSILGCLPGIGDDTEFMYSSDISASGEKSERLVNILTEIGADTYISGPGAKEYLETETFAENDIDVYWHEFDHPEYPQRHGEFVSHLSVIDVLFHMGAESTELIREAEENALVPATE